MDGNSKGDQDFILYATGDPIMSVRR